MYINEMPTYTIFVKDTRELTPKLPWHCRGKTEHIFEMANFLME